MDAHADDATNDDITPLHHIKKSLDEYHTAQHTSVTGTRVGSSSTNNTNITVAMNSTLTSPNRPPPKTPKRHSPSPKPPATVSTNSSFKPVKDELLLADSYGSLCM
jgi:hypothetical protein